MKDFDELVKALKEALQPVPFSSIPLYEYGQKLITKTGWQEILKWDGDPDKTFYVSGFVIVLDWTGATGTGSVRIKADGKELAEADNSVDDDPQLYWSSVGSTPLKFEGNNTNGHLLFEAKSDGTNEAAILAEIIGIQVKRKKKDE